MTLYIVIGIVVILLIYFGGLLTKSMSLSKEGTVLVAYIKNARRKKSDIFDKNTSNEDFYKSKYNDLMKACVLFWRFAIKVKGLPPTYRFNIQENGNLYGEFIEVNVGLFMNKLECTLEEIIRSLPKKYQDKVEHYMNNPFSPENKKIAEDTLNLMFPKDSKLLMKLANDLHNNIVNSDFLYVLCK